MGQVKRTERIQERLELGVVKSASDIGLKGRNGPVGRGGRRGAGMGSACQCLLFPRA